MLYSCFCAYFRIFSRAYGEIWASGGFLSWNKVRIQNAVTAKTKGKPTPNEPTFKANETAGGPIESSLEFETLAF